MGKRLDPLGFLTLHTGDMLLPQGAVLASFLPRPLSLFCSAQIGALKKLLGHMVPDAAHIADEDAGIRGCQTSLPFWPRWPPKAVGQSTREEACRAGETEWRQETGSDQRPMGRLNDAPKL